MAERLWELLRRAIALHPEHGIRYADDDTFLSYEELRRDALAVARALMASGVQANQRVVVMVARTQDFFPAFWGVIAAGATPAPVAAPRSASRNEVERIQGLLAVAGTPHIVVDRGAKYPIPGTLDVGELLGSAPLDEPRCSDAPGLIQFSSGSTGRPKGVVLSQRALRANVRQMAEHLPLRDDDVLLNWMPHYHDFGLIGLHLLPMIHGLQQVRVATHRMISDPVHLLRAAAEHRANVISSTNLLLDRINRRFDASEGLDLSSVRFVCTGAEPMSPAVLRRFFEQTGIDERAHVPMYGMAEACVGIFGGAAGIHTVLHDDREYLVTGTPLPEIRVRVVDADGQDVPPGTPGELWFRGPNQFDGYLNDPERTREARRGSWIVTGDVVVETEVGFAPIGRLKDVICIGGRNLHAADVEQVAEAVAGVKRGGTVAFADHSGEVEGLAVGVLTDSDRPAAQVLWALRNELAGQVGVEPSAVFVLPDLPRTTSGKKQRSRVRQAFSEGRYDNAVGSTLPLIRSIWGEVLGRDLAPDDDQTRFADLGGGSVQAMEVLGRIEDALGIAADPMLLRQADTILSQALVLERQPRPQWRARPATPRSDAGAVAIVGMAGRFPGASSPEQLWDLIERNAVQIGPPPSRWLGDPSYTGAFLEDVATFDAAKFGIRDREACAMDPQQRMVLTVAVEALERAGMGPQGRNPVPRATAVYVGAGQQPYVDTVRAHLEQGLPAETMPGNLLNMMAARVAHHLDLHGPALTVDTACSSALVALDLGVRSIRMGEAEVAVVGAVNLNLDAMPHRMFEIAGALSKSGHCRPLTEQADGTVPGEGAGAVVLKSLDRALRDGDPVLGVIRGIAVNNDGASLGIMAPNPKGQEAVLQAALADSGVEASEVTFVEAHASGTPIGDPVERRVIGRVYGDHVELGASKSVVGHLLNAAGIVGLIRAVGELERHRYAAVSAFGFGGTNAHVVLQAPPDQARSAMFKAMPPVSPKAYWLDAVAMQPLPERPRQARTVSEGPLDWLHAVRRDVGGGLLWSPLQAEPSSVLREGSSVLVTGGTGALGRPLVRWLVREWAAQVTVVGRRVLSTDLRAEFEQLGVSYVRADVANADEVSRLAASVGSVDTLFHVAGVTGPTASQVKLGALQHLQVLEPRLQILYGSISGVLPGLDKGIEAYAEANRELDRFAQRHHTPDRPVVCIDWPPFVGAGMAADAADQLSRAGLRAIEVDFGLDLLDQALRCGVPQVVVSPRPKQRAVALPADLKEQIRSKLEEISGRKVKGTDTFPQLGIDSLTAMDLVHEIEALVGHGLPTTLLFENDHLDALVRALESGARREEAAAVDVSQRRVALASQQTFIVQNQFFPDIPGNVWMAVTLSGSRREAMQRGPLEAALAVVAARHPTLSSVFDRDGDDWVEVPGPAPAVEWLQALDEHQLFNQPFDVRQGPLLRVYCDGTRLICNAHHSVVDAWSLKNVVEELVAVHEALVAERSPELPVLPTQWDQAASALAALPKRDDDPFWEDLFADGVPPLDLPWVGDPSAPASGPCYAHQSKLDSSTTTRLIGRAREAGVRLPALVLAAYLRVLFEFSGQHDVVVRVAQGRRELRLPGIERVVGSFADSLPVRVALAAGEGLGELAQRVQDHLADVSAHADASAIGLARLGARTGAGPTGLTPAGFSFPLLPDNARIGGLRLSEVHGGSASGFTRIGLICFAFDGHLQSSWNFPSSHLSEQTVQAMAEAHADLLTAFAEGRETGRALLAPGPDVGESLQARILANCEALGDREAVQGLSYRGLARRSAALATELAPHVGGNEPVAVIGSPSADSVVALLGTLRTGAFYVPLDPVWPDARIAQVLEVAQPVAAVAQTEALAARLRTLFDGTVIATTEAEREHGPLVEGRFAYSMFTSGSTGRPKGVLVQHSAVLQFLAWVQRRFGVTEADRFVQTSSLGFGGSIRQMWSPLLAGASIHPVGKDILRDPSALVGFIRDEGITIWNSVPSMWMHLLDACVHAEGDPMASVRWVLIGGEVVPTDYVRRWRAHFGRRHRLVNLYGSTETIVNATSWEISDSNAPLTPIGWPRFGTEVELVNVEDGVGQLAVSGAIATEYLNSPEQTAKAFVERDGRRWYLTGDLARKREDGAFVYLGRIDSQVQVRGNRVELGEVEAVLCEHPHVAHAAVVFADGHLFGFVEGPSEGLRDWLAGRLPGYMVPSRISSLSSLPRTAAGKVDRLSLARGLESPEQVADALPMTSAVLPEGELVEVICATWQSVLKLADRPGPDDDFFGLGGDSIDVLEVLERLRSQVDQLPPPLTLYEKRTPRLLADALVAATPVRAVRAHGLHPVQRGFWLAHKANPERPPVWTARLPLRGPLDPEAFGRAVQWVVRRHPVLRTRFPQMKAVEEPQWHQTVSLDDLSVLPEHRRAAALQARFDEMQWLHFDLDALPLMHLRLVKLDATEWELLIAAHHIIADAQSAFVLASELLKAHDALRSGKALPTSVMPPMAARTVIDDEGFWVEHLRGWQGKRGPRQGGQEHLRFTLETRVWKAIQDHSRRLSVSPFVTVFAAVFAALAEVTGESDVVVSTALAGRDTPELARAVGPYAVGLPVRPVSHSEAQVARAFAAVAAHSNADPMVVAAAAGPDALARLARFFFTWQDPRVGGELPSGSVQVDWQGAETAFESQSTETECMVGALVGEGLTLTLHGGPLVHAVAPVLERRLRAVGGPSAALVVYAPAGAVLPVTDPMVVETIESAAGVSELVLMPLTADTLATRDDLEAQVKRALRVTRAPTVALAGMLPALTGLATRKLTDANLTTGHAVTVCAMALTVRRILAETGRSWQDQVVGCLGYGAVGQSTLALCRRLFGEPKAVLKQDPRLPDSAESLYGCTLILGASSGGATLDVDQLQPGALVVDDSFPRCFDDTKAMARMTEVGDVLCVGGGMMDIGPLARRSPFPQAELLRAKYGGDWLPGCHAEAVLVAAHPELGPSVGVVDLERAQTVLAQVQAEGWDAAPLHLAGWVVPDDLVERVRRRG